MIGILESFVCAFNPFWVFDRLEKNSRIVPKHVIAFVFISLLALVCFHFSSPIKYREYNITFISRVGFVIGFAFRILVSAYLLSWVISSVSKTQLKFRTTFPIVTYATSTLLYPFLIYALNPRYFALASWFSLFWFMIIVAIGVWKKTNLSFLKVLLLTMVTILIFWLIIVTFIPYGQRI